MTHLTQYQEQAAKKALKELAELLNVTPTLILIGITENSSSPIASELMDEIQMHGA